MNVKNTRFTPKQHLDEQRSDRAMLAYLREELAAKERMNLLNASNAVGETCLQLLSTLERAGTRR